MNVPVNMDPDQYDGVVTFRNGHQLNGKCSGNPRCRAEDLDCLWCLAESREGRECHWCLLSLRERPKRIGS